MGKRKQIRHGINLETPHFDHTFIYTHTFYAKESENGSLLLFINQQYINIYLKNARKHHSHLLESISSNLSKMNERTIYRNR